MSGVPSAIDPQMYETAPVDFNLPALLNMCNVIKCF